MNAKLKLVVDVMAGKICLVASRNGHTNQALMIVRMIQNNELAEPFREAMADVERYIKKVRSAHDADPNWTDDDICQKILNGIKERRAARWVDLLHLDTLSGVTDEPTSSEPPASE